MHQVSTKSEHFIAPLAARKLQAAMKLKALSLADVSKKAKVPYTIASRLLGGKHHQRRTGNRRAQCRQRQQRAQLRRPGAVGQRHPMLDGLGAPGHGLDQRQEGQVEEQHLVLGMVGDPHHLVGVQARVERVQHRADALEIVDDAGDTVTELSGGGIDTVMSSVDYTLGAEVERLTGTKKNGNNHSNNGSNHGLPHVGPHNGPHIGSNHGGVNHGGVVKPYGPLPSWVADLSPVSWRTVLQITAGGTPSQIKQRAASM